MVLDHCIVIINTLRFSSNVKLEAYFMFCIYFEFVPIPTSFHFKLVLKGLSRLTSHCPNQAQPITLLFKK
jgi:hypothetical protein